MSEAFETVTGDGNVPASFIFFAQFVDHDITLDATTRLTDIAVDPSAIQNVVPARLMNRFATAVGSNVVAVP